VEDNVRCLHILKSHFDSVDSVLFSPDGRRIVSGQDDGLGLWDAMSGTQLCRRSIFVMDLHLTVHCVPQSNFADAMSGAHPHNIEGKSGLGRVLSVALLGWCACCIRVLGPECSTTGCDELLHPARSRRSFRLGRVSHVLSQRHARRLWFWG
jgi:WD40 repeat protein